MTNCRFCGRPGQLVATNERQTVRTISASHTTDSKSPAVVMRSCPVYEQQETCYFHGKVMAGLFGEQSKRNLLAKHERKGIWG
jgi:hypothetical protein